MSRKRYAELTGLQMLQVLQLQREKRTNRRWDRAALLAAAILAFYALMIVLLRAS